MKIKTKTKLFKIGEYAIGGIIKVNLTGKIIQVYALDWNTRRVVSQGSTGTDDHEWTYKLDKYLNHLTSHYYAEKIYNWITENL